MITLCILALSVTILVLLFKMAHCSDHETFVPLYLAGPTKCFSCERDMIQRYNGDSSMAWMGKPSKCFDCERQLAAIEPNCANYTHGTKCFDCEKS